MSLLISFRSEILKTKRTSSGYLCIIGALLLPASQMIDYIFDDGVAKLPNDPWNRYLFNGFEPLTILILPLCIILLCTLIPQIEYRNNTWKQLFTSPQKRRDIFLAKFLNIQMMLLLLLLLYNVFLLLSALVVALAMPTVKFFDHRIDWFTLIALNAKAYVATFAISTIQFWMGLRFKNFITPLAIGFGLWVMAGMILLEFKMPNAWLFPYTYPLLTVHPDYKYLGNSLLWISLGFGSVFLAMAFLEFRYRTIRS